MTSHPHAALYLFSKETAMNGAAILANRCMYIRNLNIFAFLISYLHPKLYTPYPTLPIKYYIFFLFYCPNQIILLFQPSSRELDRIGRPGFLDFVQVVVLAHIIEIACKNRVLRMTNKDKESSYPPCRQGRKILLYSLPHQAGCLPR